MVEITPRLRHLLLLLSSDKPGEVIAAAAAVGRTLHAAGADWHDLVNGLLGAAASELARKPEEPHYEPDEEDWHEMREFCLEREHKLRSREREFIHDLERWRGDLTERQAAWLCAIYERLRRGG